MIRKALRIFLATTSVVLTLACILSHWHPMHASTVWDNGVQSVDIQMGGAFWHREAGRRLYRAPPNWGCREYFLPGGFGVRALTDGLRSVTVPGLWVQWCWQRSGYRRFDAIVDFFTLALLAALYPTLSVVAVRSRRFLRLRQGRCLHCGYDLKGNLSGVCPECGKPTSTTVDHESAPRP